MTEIALISVGVILQSLTFAIGILVGKEIKGQKNDSDKGKKETQRQLDQRDPAWWHRVDIERRGFKGGTEGGWQRD